MKIYQFVLQFCNAFQTLLLAQSDKANFILKFCSDDPIQF